MKATAFAASQLVLAAVLGLAALDGANAEGVHSTQNILQYNAILSAEQQH